MWISDVHNYETIHGCSFSCLICGDCPAGKTELTRYSVTKRIYLGKRKDCSSVHADVVSHVCILNQTKMKEELMEGKRQLRELMLVCMILGQVT